MEQLNNQPVILNRPRRSKRGLTIDRNGRFSLRTQLIRLLDLHAGDGIVFVRDNGQVYMIKSSTILDHIILSGRDGQLHGNSVATAKHLFLFIEGMKKDAKVVDLVVGNETEKITIDGKGYDAVAIITRTDSSHCK